MEGGRDKKFSTAFRSAIMKLYPQHYGQFVGHKVLFHIFPASIHKWKPRNLCFMHLWQFPMTKPSFHASYVSDYKKKLRKRCTVLSIVCAMFSENKSLNQGFLFFFLRWPLNMKPINTFSINIIKPKQDERGNSQPVIRSKKVQYLWN